ncbi:hypothetical protein HPB49_013976 [Dermacentor silvarum]|uniref:Uncharacterized protein n=1 Tax=Dermacentor silvarum TaxID=543639 RepID=A0ACB8CFE6_DERSI|nr:hypothetical protein HPB49_013976 [Dermacentor silvarum]
MAPELGYGALPTAGKGALPLRFEVLPQWLKRLGYSTHMVGKWHLGYKSLEHTPTWRGFDTFFGYYNGQEFYFNHTTASKVSTPERCVFTRRVYNQKKVMREPRIQH